MGGTSTIQEQEAILPLSRIRQ